MRSWKLLVVAFGVIVALLVSIMAWRVLTGDDDAGNDEENERLITSQVDIRDLTDSITINGTLERSEVSTVNAVASGLVSKVDIDDGATVETGSSILTLDGRSSVAVTGDVQFFRTLDVGSEGADVLQLEQILDGSGFAPGEIDTVYTESTRLALANWQNFHGYPGSSAETDETVTVSLSPSAGYTVGSRGSAAAVIGPPDPLGFQTLPVAQLTTFPTTLGEGGTISVTVTIDASQATDTVLNLIYTGTAAFGVDYDDPGSTVTIPAGSTSATFPLTISSDSLIEPEESVVISLTATSGYTLGAQTATTIRIPASGGDPVLTVRAETTSVPEGAPITFTILASEDPSGDRDVNFAISGTATNGVDHFAPIGPIPLGDTATQLTVVVPTSSDAIVEPDETVELIVLPGSGYQVGNPSAATATILSTNVPEFVLSGETAVSEGQQATLQITTDQAPGEDVGVTIQVSGDAVAGDDYTALDANIIFPAGATSLDLPITTLTDDVFEEDEDVVVTLVGSQLGSYQVGPISTQTVTILGTSDAEDLPILKIWPDNTITAEGQPAVFTVTSDREVGQALDLVLSFSGSAADGFDIIAPVATVSIPAGQVSTTFQVQTRQDNAVEYDEIVTAHLEASSGYRVSLLHSASVTILSDDVPEIQVRGGGTVGEGSATSFTFTADQPVVEDTSISYQAIGTATPGVDFRPVTGTVLMRAGQSSASVQIATLADDVVFRPTDMIVADWPARIGTVLVEAGQPVQPGLPLFNLTEPDFSISIDVNSNDRGDLSVGQEVLVEVAAAGIDTDGVITELDDASTVDVQTGAESYKGVVDLGEGLSVVDGATARVEVILERRDGAVTVPIAAVGQNEEGDESVRVLNLDSGRIEDVVVVTGLQEDAFIEIVSGLEGNEVVVVAVER